MRHDLARDAIFFNDRHANSDVSEFEEELIRWVVCWNASRERVTCNQGVCLNNFLYLDIDKVVERVDMLFDQTSQAKESWDEFPFLLHSANHTLKLTL